MNRICEALKIEKPVIQGPMLWLTDAKLVAAVSEAGGMGTLGINAGQTEAARTPEDTAERMREQVHEVRALTDKPFAINIGPMEPDIFTQPMLDMIYEEKVPAVVYADAGILDFAPYFRQLKEHGVKIVYRPLNPTREMVRRAEELGADVIVATGFDEGGTLPAKVIGTFTIVPIFCDWVDHVPVMAAGGISDARTGAAAFALGAEGLFAGSAFLLSQESRMDQGIKEKAVQTSSFDLHLYRTEPDFYRSLPGALPDHLQQMSDEGASRAQINRAANGYRGMKNGMFLGDLQQGYASFGTGLGLIHSIDPVSVIVDRLLERVKY